PFFVLLAFGASLGAGLWIAALMVEYRDFRFIVPFMVQFGLYISPVGFRSSIVSRPLSPLIRAQSDGGSHRRLPLVRVGQRTKHLLVGGRRRAAYCDRLGCVRYLVFQKDRTNFCRCDLSSENGSP